MLLKQLRENKTNLLLRKWLFLKKKKSQQCLKYVCTLKVLSDLTTWKAKWKIILLFLPG